MEFLIILLVAVSLSMDAFSLALAYGTLSLDKKNIIYLSLIVGIYHFFMPLIGMFIGSKLFLFLPIKHSFIVFMILSFIGVQMIIETKKCEKEVKKMDFFQLLMFGLAVSIDSFSVGIGLNTISNNVFMCAFIFSIVSLMFTFLGLVLGKKINMILGKVSTLIGGVILIIIGLFSLF